MTNDKELINRLEDFIEFEAEVSIAAFANKANIDPSGFAKMLKGQQTITPATIKKICSAWGIEKRWLTDGVEPMLSPKKDEEPAKPFQTELYTVLLLPISAQGGSFNDFVVSVSEAECEKIISPIKGADFAISVSGDSMAPEYPPGSQVLIKKINERAFIDWGRVYVLDTCNGTVIKKLLPSEKPDTVVCRSINPEYPSFEVSLADVYGVYRVLMCMSLK